MLDYSEPLLPVLTDIYLFEKNSEIGVGMPYSRSTTDKYNLCNISSAEIPQLHQSLVDWLKSLNDDELALYDADKLELVSGRVSIEDKCDGVTKVEVDNDGHISERTYRMFIDCSGQGSIAIDDYPFPSLVKDGSLTEAVAGFRDDSTVDKTE